MYAECKVKNAKYGSKTKTLCEGLLKNNLQGTPQVGPSSPAYQYTHNVQEFFSEEYDLRENTAVNGTSCMFPFASSSLIKIIAWDWMLAKLMDKFISKLDMSSQNKIWNLMSVKSKDWIREKMHWSVMTIVLGLCPHAVFRFLATNEARFEIDSEELVRLYIEQVAAFPSSNVMKLLTHKVTDKLVSVPSVEWLTHIMNNRRAASDVGVSLTNELIIQAIFWKHSSLRIIQPERGQVSHGSMLESCEEDISSILKTTKFMQILVSTPLPNPEQATLKSFVKWFKSLVDEHQINEPLATGFFDIMKRVESCVKEDGAGLLEEEKGAAEEDSGIDDNQAAPKSAMRAGAKNKASDKALKLKIKNKDKTAISAKELREKKVSATEFYKICKQLSDDIPEVSPTPCYYCMIGVCNKTDHI